MKILLDQNISYKSIKELAKYYKEVAQVGRLGMAQTEDAMIWQYARTHGYAMVTFEAYFHEKNMLLGHQIKVIWLRFENNSTQNVIRILIKKRKLIQEFIENENYTCLELFDD